MSYSRWSNSCWYVYHDANGGGALESELLTIQDHGSFTYKELKAGFDHILDKIRDERFDRNPRNYKGEGEPPKDRFTEDEINELKKYITMFIEDCEFRHDPKNIEKYGDIVNLLGRG